MYPRLGPEFEHVSNGKLARAELRGHICNRRAERPPMRRHAEKLGHSCTVPNAWTVVSETAPLHLSRRGDHNPGPCRRDVCWRARARARRACVGMPACDLERFRPRRAAIFKPVFRPEGGACSPRALHSCDRIEQAVNFRYQSSRSVVWKTINECQEVWRRSD